MRATPNFEPSPPNVNGPWTGKIFEPVAVSVAGGAGAAATFGATVSFWRKYCLDPRTVTTRRAVYWPGVSVAVHVALSVPLAFTRPSRARTAGLPGAIRSTRASAFGTAVNANVTAVPSVTVDGEAVNPLAVGAAAPPLWAWAAGAANRAMSTAKTTITAPISARDQCFVNRCRRSCARRDGDTAFLTR